MLPAPAGSVLCILFYADENQKTEKMNRTIIQEGIQ